MIAKLIEIRDRATFIVALAVQLSSETEHERYLLARTGYGRDPASQAEYILLGNVSGGGGVFTSDPHHWQDRTMQTAHAYIVEKWSILASGDVVDVEYILGETEIPAERESVEC